MAGIALILMIAVATYATRVAGFALGQRTLPPVLEQFLLYVPIAVLAALVAPNLGTGSAELWPRLLGALATTITMLRVRQLWAGLVLGMVAYWIARSLLQM